MVNACKKVHFLVFFIISRASKIDLFSFYESLGKLSGPHLGCGITFLKYLQIFSQG